ncbi:MAG: hypothetical protein ACMVY4_07770 [Minwuia sp.]|uniref:hypothetical protein n=1 Tax=Minwuia sp. TaxID=2493630 RepID=UPI003A8B6C05
MTAAVETFAQIEQAGGLRLSVTFSDGEIVLQAEGAPPLRMDDRAFQMIADLRRRHEQAQAVVRS